MGDEVRDLNDRFWPNPVVRSSKAGCQVKNPAAAATGRYRPKPDLYGYSCSGVSEGSNGIVWLTWLAMGYHLTV